MCKCAIIEQLDITIFLISKNTTSIKFNYGTKIGLIPYLNKHK